MIMKDNKTQLSSTHDMKIPCLLAGISFMAASLFSSVSEANTFIFNPKTQQWKAISSSGKVVRTGHGSSGRAYCPDTHRACRTPTGTFHVISKQGANCKSSRYPVGKGGSPMPYCMYFTTNYAVHGSYEVPNYNASHGCIRIYPADARWLYNHFMSVGTTVIVKPY